MKAPGAAGRHSVEVRDSSLQKGDSAVTDEADGVMLDTLLSFFLHQDVGLFENS